MARRTTGGRARRRDRTTRNVATPGSPLTGALHKIRDDLTELAVPYALVGGLAVSARAEPRLTRDVDLAIHAPDDASAEHVIRQLMGRGYKVTGTLEQLATGRLATARLTPPGRTKLLVDLLFARAGSNPRLSNRPRASRSSLPSAFPLPARVTSSP